jgi:hypothetical protein
MYVRVLSAFSPTANCLPSIVSIAFVPPFLTQLLKYVLFPKPTLLLHDRGSFPRPLFLSGATPCVPRHLAFAFPHAILLIFPHIRFFKYVCQTFLPSMHAQPATIINSVLCPSPNPNLSLSFFL